MSKIWTRFRGNDCEHESTLTVRSVGVERIVCEDCGHISFSIAPNLVMTHELTPQYGEEPDLEKVS